MRDTTGTKELRRERPICIARNKNAFFARVHFPHTKRLDGERRGDSRPAQMSRCASHALSRPSIPRYLNTLKSALR